MNEKTILGMILAVVLITGLVNAQSLSLSLNSLSPIGQGETATLTATVSASGGSVSGVTATFNPNSGLSTSSQETQSIGTLTNGQSSSKSWTISGDSSGTYTLTVVASGTSVTSQTAQTTLSVTSPAFISVSENISGTSGDSATTSTFTHNITLSNTGGASTTVTINPSVSSNLSITAGTDPYTTTLSGGSSISTSYTYRLDSCGNGTVNVAITSGANNPSDPSYNITNATTCSTGGGTGSGTLTSNAARSTGGGTPQSAAQSQIDATNTSKSSTATRTNTLNSYYVPIPSNAQTLLDQANAKMTEAQTEFDAGNYAQAQTLAVQARTLYAQATALLPTATVNKSSSSSYAHGNTTTTRNISVLTITDAVTGNETTQSTIVLKARNENAYDSDVTIRETIPKEVAQDASELTFYPANPTIINADPVIEWTIQVPAGEEREVAYTTSKTLTENDYADYQSPSVKSVKTLTCTETCDDGNSCTVDVCGSNGTCTHNPLSNGVICGNGLTCQEGTCAKTPELRKATGAFVGSAAIVTPESPHAPLWTQAAVLLIAIIILGLGYAYNKGYLDEFLNRKHPPLAGKRRY